MVSKIKKPNHKFGYLASIMLGVLPSSFFAIITFDSETQVWYRVTVLCLFIISFVLSITFYFIHKGQDDVNGVMGQDILHEMHMIEDQFKSSVSDGSEIPL